MQRRGLKMGCSNMCAKSKVELDGMFNDESERARGTGTVPACWQPGQRRAPNCHLAFLRTIIMYVMFSKYVNSVVHWIFQAIFQLSV